MTDPQLKQMLDALDHRLDTIEQSMYNITYTLSRVESAAKDKGHFLILLILLGIVLGGCPVRVM